jgi:hypothetical protein
MSQIVPDMTCLLLPEPTYEPNCSGYSWRDFPEPTNEPKCYGYGLHDLT